MQVSDFDFDLPEHLIAQAPLPERAGSRLLHLDGSHIRHRHFADIVDLLNPADLLVFNDTRVIPARVYGRKETGGRIEMLVERVFGDQSALVQIKSSKAPKPGSDLILEDGTRVTVDSREGGFYTVRLEADLLATLENIGHMPLPPYIHRPDDSSDRERYQTVFARAPGAVAAPTAGLHFDETLFDALEAKGVERAFLTLHVGAGTFQPVRVERIEDHVMHREYVNVPKPVCDAVAACRARGGRVIAVGTTSVRSLESAALGGELAPFAGETDIFIYPGFEFRVVDAMITNFHLPGSTLLMLIAAFAGQSNVLAAYREAIAQEYRFFSYGDAMFLTRDAT